MPICFYHLYFELVAAPSAQSVGRGPDLHDEGQAYRCADDYRYDRLRIESIDMESHSMTALERAQIAEATHASVENAKTFALGLKARYVPSIPRSADIGWGVVHLYREAQHSEETGVELSTKDDITPNEPQASSSGSSITNSDCTTLCILAVPSYMTPSDLLGWLGEDMRELVSHFRLVRTSRSNRYMVLIKFRESLPAVRWQREWNGKLFSSMEVGFPCSVHNVHDLRQC